MGVQAQHAADADQAEAQQRLRDAEDAANAANAAAAAAAANLVAQQAQHQQEVQTLQQGNRVDGFRVFTKIMRGAGQTLLGLGKGAVTVMKNGGNVVKTFEELIQVVEETGEGIANITREDYD